MQRIALACLGLVSREHKAEGGRGVALIGNIPKAIDQATERFFPGYFGLVMATGIVSIGAHFLQIPLAIPRLLFGINIVAYGILWILILLRLLRHFHRVAADLVDYHRGPGFFTIVAASSILGGQCLIFSSSIRVGTFLWLVALFLWCVLTYTFLVAVMVRQGKPELVDWIHGGWLLIVVATQSLSVLGTMMPPHSPWREFLLFFGLAMYLLGCMQYILITSLIFYRLLFFRIGPKELLPPYWINMGAAAITTLAGAMLILKAPEGAFLLDIVPFLKGLTLFFWVIGTWWIPLLLILGIWRHLYKRFPITYDPMYWSIVFPLGMYTASTFQLGKATGLSFFFPISYYSVHIALLAWLIVFAGLLHRILRNLVIAR